MIGNLSQPDSLSCVHFALVGRQRQRCQKARKQASQMGESGTVAHAPA